MIIKTPTTENITPHVSPFGTMDTVESVVLIYFAGKESVLGDISDMTLILCISA